MQIKNHDPIKERPDVIRVDVDEVLRETPKAYYILWDGKQTKSWFPKGQCNLEGDVLNVPKWLYDKKVDEIINEAG